MQNLPPNLKVVFYSDLNRFVIDVFRKEPDRAVVKNSQTLYAKVVSESRHDNILVFGLRHSIDYQHIARMNYRFHRIADDPNVISGKFVFDKVFIPIYSTFDIICRGRRKAGGNTKGNQRARRAEFWCEHFQDRTLHISSISFGRRTQTARIGLF